MTQQGLDLADMLQQPQRNKALPTKSDSDSSQMNSTEQEDAFQEHATACVLLSSTTVSDSLNRLCQILSNCVDREGGSPF